MFIEAGMVGMLGDDFTVPIIIMIAAIILYIKPVEAVVPLAVKILVPAVLVGYFFFRYVSIPPLFARSEWVFPINITLALAECFLFGQIFELIKKRDPKEGLLNFCLLAMAVVVCACCRVASGSSRSLLFVGSVVCVTLICTVFQYSTQTFVTAERSRKQNYTYRTTLIAITMTLVGFSSWYLSGSIQDNIERFQNWWVKNFQTAGLGIADTSISFNNDATLQNITNLKNSNPLNPTLRIYCDAPPGYLRGRAYTRFSGTKWLRDRASGVVIPRSDPPVRIESTSDAFFRLNESDLREYKRIRVMNQTAMSFFFVPLNSTYVSGQLVSRDPNLRTDVEKIVVGNISPTASYSGYVDRYPPQFRMSQERREYLTRIPRSIEQPALDRAREVTADDSTDREVISSIEYHFRSNYNYSLEQKEFPSNRDQVSFFILEQPAAHCEFFASAAVIFLRANGIPARYVTGFATTELSDDEDYYIARNKDAHAWAEAYDRDNQQWVVVEATPDTDLPKSIWNQNDDDDGSNADATSQRGADVSRNRFSNMFQRIWIQIREFFEEIGRQLRGPLNIALTSLLVIGIVYRYWWKPRNQQRFQSLASKLERERQRVEKLLAKLRIYRRENETMHQFEQRIQVECDALTREKLTDVLNWFGEYERLRFGAETSVDAHLTPPTLRN